MKKIILGTAILVSALAANAESFSYYSNPTYCNVNWNCDIVSTDMSEAANFCISRGFSGTATVYERASGQKPVLKGYGCLEHR